MTKLNTMISTLLVRYANGEASPEEKRQLNAWASLSAENRLWLEQFADPGWRQQHSAAHHTIDLDERSQTFWSMVAAHETQPTAPAGKPGKLRHLPALQWMAKAAAILLLVTTGAYFFLSPKNKMPATAGLVNTTKATPPAIDSNALPAPNPMRYMQAANGGAANEPAFIKLPIPAAGYHKILLPDGSRVWLNAMTVFTYPPVFKGNKRKVEITGEAYFEVTYNESMPFLAVVNGVAIETTGGRFNINAYDNETAKRVTVLQGQVTVAIGPHALPVHEKQAALVKKDITVDNNVNIPRAIAWKNRKCLYKQDSLALVIKELARRYDLLPEGRMNPHTLISYCAPWSKTANEALTAIKRQNKNFHFKLEGKRLIVE